MEGAAMTTAHVFIDGVPGEYDGPTEADISYADMDPDTLFELAVQGDPGAVAHLNGAEPQTAEVNEKGQVVLPPITPPAGLAPGDTIVVEWADDEAPPPSS